MAYLSYVDVARHQGIYELNIPSLGLWAFLVTQLNMTPLDAFSLMSYSFIPNFVEF